MTDHTWRQTTVWSSWRKLHRKSDRLEILINLDGIATIEPASTGGARLWSIATDDCWDVIESPEEIMG